MCLIQMPIWWLQLSALKKSFLCDMWKCVRAAFIHVNTEGAFLSGGPGDKKCGTPQRRVTWRTDSRIPAGLGAHILSLPPTHTLLRPDLLDLLLINVTVVTRRTGHPVWRVVSDIMCQMFQAHGWILIPKHSSSSCPAALKWWEQ